MEPLSDALGTLLRAAPPSAEWRQRVTAGVAQRRAMASEAMVDEGASGDAAAVAKACDAAMALLEVALGPEPTASQTE